MATTLYFRSTPWTSGGEYGKWSAGTNLTNLAGSGVGWTTLRWYQNRGTGTFTHTRATVTGPTNGLEIGAALGTHWISAPLDADTTISGNITANLRFSGNSSANAQPRVVIQRIDSVGAIQETIVDSTSGIEITTTTETAYNWTAAVTTTAVHKGDRLRCRVAIDDAPAQTMATGQTINFYSNGPTAAASGDSYITFDTTFSVPTDFPTPGTTIYPTDTDSDVTPNGSGYASKRAWTAAQSSSIARNTNTAAGWTTPVQVTSFGGAFPGPFLEWFTPQLNAVTLGGLVKVNHRGSEVSTNDNVAPRCEVAVCNSDGTSPVVWAANTSNDEFGLSDAVNLYNVAGDDVGIAQGQRIRIRFFLDDTTTTPMTAGGTGVMTYNGPASAAPGNTYLTFPVTLTEFVGGTTVTVNQVTETDSTLAPESLQMYPIAQVGELSGAQAFTIEDIVTGLSASPISSTAITLSWDDFPNAVGYDIERNGTVIVEEHPASDYQDTGLTPETTYSYRVRAVI